MSAQGAWPAIFFLIASALLWVVPRSDAKCDTKSLHTVEALPGAFGLGVEVEAAGRKPTLRPAAEAVIQTAPAAMATAPTANPRTRRWRKVAMLLITPLLDLESTLRFRKQT